MTDHDLISDVLVREGWPRVTNHPWDKGRWTKGGVTQAALAEWRGHEVTVNELADLTEADARAFYRQRYLQPYTDLGIPDPLRLLLFDVAVTSWHDDAARFLQIGLKHLGLYSARVDGRIGPATRTGLAYALANPTVTKALYREVLAARFEQLAREAVDDAKTQAFLRANKDVDLHNLVGWIRRCTEFIP